MLQGYARACAAASCKGWQRRDARVAAHERRICDQSAISTTCTPGDARLQVATTPPPGYTDRLNSARRTMLISRGVALAFTCAKHGPCRNASARSANPGVAQVLPGYLDRLEETYLRGKAPETTFIVTAVAVGQTRIDVTTDDGDASIEVTVIE
jgi:hypothetical protein